MKRKVLCIALALLMCMTAAVPTFADGAEETPPEKSGITFDFGLTHISGSTYRMWAIINNPQGANVTAVLILYNALYLPISIVNTASSSTSIYMSKNVTLSSGTYHLRLTCSVDGSTYTSEKTYTI